MFRAIASDDFPPFGKFRLDFPEVKNKPADLAEVHLLTGVNGTGKTRMLAAMAALLGGPKALLRRSKGLQEQNELKCADESTVLEKTDLWWRIHYSEHGAGEPQTYYALARSCKDWTRQVPAFAFNGVAFLSDAKIHVLAGLAKPDRADVLDFSRPEKLASELIQAIANLKMQAALDSPHSENMGSSPRSVRMIQTIERMLSDITGRPFQFAIAAYPEPKLFVRWANTELCFNLLPDGLRSIIGWMVGSVVMFDTWLQGKGEPLDTDVVFLLDEIESHLHPAWQRRILPAFQRLFPKAQIFVATHSPFVIASLTHGWIHRLTMGADGMVEFQKPVAAGAGQSYISVVEDIMGVHEWYGPETEQMLAQFREQRDIALQGDSSALTRVTELAGVIGQRSLELNYMMGQEMSQLNRHLAKPNGA